MRIVRQFQPRVLYTILEIHPETTVARDVLPVVRRIHKRGAQLFRGFKRSVAESALD